MKHAKAQMMCREIELALNKAGMALSPKIRAAMESIDRELFVPKSHKSRAYSLDAFLIGENQWISSVLSVAKMTQILAPNGGDSVLEIGCGSGYQAMVLSFLFRRVCSIERINALLLEAKERFRALGVTNILTKLADGQDGWESYAPFDCVLFSASTKEVPPKIVAQMAENGRLVAPIELANGKQQIQSFAKKNGALVKIAAHEECLFVPVLSGIA